jgi:hypothetical protein
MLSLKGADGIVHNAPRGSGTDRALAVSNDLMDHGMEALDLADAIEIDLH